jgi:hypothetical protein
MLGIEGLERGEIVGSRALTQSGVLEFESDRGHDRVNRRKSLGRFLLCLRRRGGIAGRLACGRSGNGIRGMCRCAVFLAGGRRGGACRLLIAGCRFGKGLVRAGWKSGRSERAVGGVRRGFDGSVVGGLSAHRRSFGPGRAGQCSE